MFVSFHHQGEWPLQNRLGISILLIMCVRTSGVVLTEQITMRRLCSSVLLHLGWDFHKDRENKGS